MGLGRSIHVSRGIEPIEVKGLGLMTTYLLA